MNGINLLLLIVKNKHRYCAVYFPTEEVSMCLCVERLWDIRTYNAVLSEHSDATVLYLYGT